MGTPAMGARVVFCEISVSGEAMANPYKQGSENPYKPGAD